MVANLSQFRGASLRSSLRFLLHSRQFDSCCPCCCCCCCCRLLLLARVGRSVCPTLPVPMTYSLGSVVHASSVVHLRTSPFMGNARFATETGGKRRCGPPPMGGPHPRPRSALAPTVKPVSTDGKEDIPYHSQKCLQRKLIVAIDRSTSSSLSLPIPKVAPAHLGSN